MKRFYVLLLALCAVCMAQAQVGVVRSSGVYSVQKAKPQDLGPLTRNGNIYYYHGEPMKEAQMVQFLNENCQEAYNYYKKQRKIEKIGWGLFGGGALMCVGIGVPLLCVDGSKTPNFELGMTFTCVGAISCVLVGVPMVIAGNVQKKNAHKVYNTWCGYKELEQAQATPLELKLTSGANGIGVALAF